MEIGTIGAGAFAQAFAKQALKAGHKVKLSNRHDPDSLRETVDQLGPGATAATREEAAACEIVLLAVPWDDVPETLASLPKWKNQVLIDGTNPFHGRAGAFTLADVGNLSTSQLIAALAPGARVVKALNTMTVPNLEANSVVNGATRVAFISRRRRQGEGGSGSLTCRFRLPSNRSWKPSRWWVDSTSRRPSRRSRFVGGRRTS